MHKKDIRDSSVRTLPSDCKWEYEKEINDKRDTFFYTYWHYKDGYFNPWIQKEIFELYLQSKGLPGIEGMCNGHKYKIIISGLPDYNEWAKWRPRIRLRLLHKADERVFSTLADTIEEYCISGYHPGNDVLLELLKKYAPVRIETDSYFSGYHDESDFETIFYNADDEEIARVVKRSVGSVESGVMPLWDFLKENTGEAQVFGL